MQAASDVAIALKAILAIGAAGVREALHGVEIDQCGVGKGKPMFSPINLVFGWIKLYLQVIVLQNSPFSKPFVSVRAGFTQRRLSAA